MTDAELELACEERITKIAPWEYWASEGYSLGKCLRIWTKYPGFSPLFVYSDHGVALHTHLFPHELENKAKVHFTWHPMKEQRYKNFAGKEVVQIIHPWISYKRIRGITRSNVSRGTLVFFSHGTPDVKWVGHDTAEYFAQLIDLPCKFQPVVLCLHMNDIKVGLHKDLRRYGLPIVTAGNINSANFVDHFYNIVNNFSYATSQSWGSQVAYCVELGIPYFYLGERPRLINISDNNLPVGFSPRYWDESHKEYKIKADALFSAPVDKVTDEQRAFVEALLGFDSRLNRWQVSWILWREFFRNWKKWRKILRHLSFNFLHKHGLLLMISGLLDLNLRKIIRRIRVTFQQNALPVRAPTPAKHSVIDLLGQEQYLKISQLDRYKEGVAVVQGYTVNFTDNVAFFGMLDEIFVRENYKFNCQSEPPTIIDCGANVGISVLYFKKLFPNAVIHAFEPDPDVYKKLIQTIDSNGLKNIYTYQAAVWIKDEELVFEAEGSWGGHIRDDQNAVGMKVKTIKLDSLLDRHVDFLKIDIEGAETDVIMQSKELIAKNVSKLFFEWHSLANTPQRLGEILSFFEKHGFRYHIKEALNRPTPFFYTPKGRMDSQLDIFLWK